MANSHFTALVMWRVGPSGSVEFLIVKYHYRGGVQIKFPGGTNKEYPEENALQTFKREVKHEVGITMIGKPDEVIVSGSADHQKIFVIYEDHNGNRYEGTFRTKMLKDGKEVVEIEGNEIPEVDDDEEVVMAPEWVRATDLGKSGEYEIFYSHSKPFRDTIGSIIEKYPEFTQELAHLV